MAKEWILNMANGRWGLTKKNRVRLCLDKRVQSEEC
ncbi:MAG: hypothetical protein OD815_001920 [Candidatus Alkanophagales archaeon MCA70_species_2]|nr:hypothetical protein [Candidatus Alkanophaga liquidiphilum]